MAKCLALPPEEQAAYVDHWAGERPELRDELRTRIELLAEMGFEVPELGFGPTGVPETLGDFRLIEKLGSGGMGVVYRAEQRSLGREVAIKIIRPGLLYFENSRDRFRREVEAVAQLKNPGIVPVYTVGEEQGLPYLAMEFVEGGTLSQALGRLAKRAPESLLGSDLCVDMHDRGWVELCMDITLQIADALTHAHARGILHRDVKPSNIALTPEGRVMLFDFGLTKSAGDDRLTQGGAQIGTLYLQERAHADELGVALANEQRAKERAIGDRNRRLLLADFLVDAFGEADPSRSADDPPSALEVLERGARGIELQLEGDPTTRAGLMAVIGEVYISLGQYEKAREILERAESTLRQAEDSRAELAQVLTTLGAAHAWRTRGIGSGFS